ncbi:MAG: LysM peptidoglycan-binding domain-containing protein, partial [Planktothrix sp.]
STDSNQELKPTRSTSTVNSLDTLPEGMSGAFVIPTDANTPTLAEVYQVGSGDTLDQIAKLHNVSVDAIIKANQLSDPNVLSVHQSLKIPKQLASSFSSSSSVVTTNPGFDSQIRRGSSPASQQASSTSDLSALGGRFPQAVLPVVIPSELNHNPSSVADFSEEAM